MNQHIVALDVFFKQEDEISVPSLKGRGRIISKRSRVCNEEELSRARVMVSDSGAISGWQGRV